MKLLCGPGLIQHYQSMPVLLKYFEVLILKQVFDYVDSACPLKIRSQITVT